MLCYQFLDEHVSGLWNSGALSENKLWFSKQFIKTNCCYPASNCKLACHISLTMTDKTYATAGDIQRDDHKHKPTRLLTILLY